VTFRLVDSLPASLLDQWERELESSPRTEAERERRCRIEAYLDAGHGACWLHDSRVASMVQQAIRYFDGSRYRLHAWCVMPNHVHVVFDQWSGHSISTVLWSWKSWTAKQANTLLDRSGPFWQREYHDRFIRDAAHLANAIRYVEQNPVQAGLATRPADWPWSSAAASLGAPQSLCGSSPPPTDATSPPE